MASKWKKIFRTVATVGGAAALGIATGGFGLGLVGLAGGLAGTGLAEGARVYTKQQEEKQRELLGKQQAQALAEQEAAQKAIEDEAKKKQAEMQKELLSRYGYAQTIKTSGLGVAGQAPIATKSLLGQ